MALGVILMAMACSSSKPKAAAPTTSTSSLSEATTSTTAVDAAPIVFTAAAGTIDAYLTSSPYTRQRVVAAGTGRDGTTPHGQICFVPDGTRRFVVAEIRTPAGAPAAAGWGIYQLTGDEIGAFRVRRLGGWDSPGAPSIDAPATYGCAFLPDGRLFTTDIGNQRSGAATGRVVEWFGPFDSPTVASCVVASDLATPLGLSADTNGAVYLASARAPTAGVWRYDGTFATDAASCVHAAVTSTQLVTGGTSGLSAPTAVAVAPSNKAFVVTSAPDGLVVAFDLDGANPEDLLRPTPQRPKSSPFGITVSPTGSVIYVDTALVADAKGVLTPGDRSGSLLVIDPSGGSNPAPSVMDHGLDGPDGLGLYVPGAGGGAASKV